MRTHIKESRSKGLKAADTLTLQGRPKRSGIGAENAREQTSKKALVQAVGRLSFGRAARPGFSWGEPSAFFITKARPKHHRHRTRQAR